MRNSHVDDRFACILALMSPHVQDGPDDEEEIRRWQEFNEQGGKVHVA